MNELAWIMYVSGLVTGAGAYKLISDWLLDLKIKRETPPAAMPPPHPLKNLFEHLKKQGIPFTVESMDPKNCQCPVCTARREVEKTHTRGGNDVLH
jgi:hypothetical protein